MQTKQAAADIGCAQTERKDYIHTGLCAWDHAHLGKPPRPTETPTSICAFRPSLPRIQPMGDTFDMNMAGRLAVGWMVGRCA